MSHDPKCRELAEYFLPDGASDRQKAELAQCIQSSVEDWLRFEMVTEIAPLAPRQ